MKMLSDLHIFGLILFYFNFFVLVFIIKLKDTNCKSHWNILVFCCQWNMMSDLNISHEKMSDFVPFSLFGFT